MQGLLSIEEALILISCDDSSDELQAVADDVKELVDVLMALGTIWCKYGAAMESSSEYGVDELETDDSDDDSSSSSDMEGVPVPEIPGQYTQFSDVLINQVYPLAESDNLGIDIYQRVLCTIEQSIQHTSLS